MYSLFSEERRAFDSPSRVRCSSRLSTLFACSIAFMKIGASVCRKESTSRKSSREIE